MPEEVIGGTPAEGTSGTEAQSNSEAQGAATNSGNEGGTPTQQEAQVKPIDWASIDPTTIPEDVLKKHPEYRKVVDESITRRKENQRLKKALASDEGESGDTPEPKEPTKEDKFDRFFREWEDFKQTQTQRSIADARQAAAEQAGLPKDLAGRIQGDTPEAMLADAMELAKFVAQERRPQTSATNFGSAGNDEAFKKRIQEKLSAQPDLQGPGVFAPGVQRTKGGGPRN